MTIAIEVAEPFRAEVSVERLRRAVQTALAAENAQGAVTVVISDDETIARLNQQFLGNEGPTDVLSFPAGDEESQFPLPPGTEHYWGDIIIAFPYARAQARRLGRDAAAELDLLVVHGVLHLLGYDHADAQEKAEMWARQDAILAQLQSS